MLYRFSDSGVALSGFIIPKEAKGYASILLYLDYRYEFLALIFLLDGLDGN